MANRKQEDAFWEAMRPSYPLNDAIEWIKSNLNPEDVFIESDLRQWAEENGFKEHKDD